MNIQDIKLKMKELEEKAKQFPDKRSTFRLQYRALQSAIRIYEREHPQTRLDIDK